MSSRLEGQLEAKRAVGRDSKTLLLTCSLPSGGSSLVQKVLQLPIGKPERISENSQPQSFSLDWREDLGTQREVCARQGHQPGYFGHCQASARSWPSPGPAPEAWEAARAPISCLVT